MSETLTEQTEVMAAQVVADLENPGEILAQSLILARVAEAIGRDMATEPDGDDFDSPRGGRHRRLLDEAAVLARIAKVAIDLAAAGHGPSQDADGPTEPTPVGHEPQPVSGVRFVAEVRGRFLGRVGGAEWMWGERFGYLDVTHAKHVGIDEQDEVSARFSGVVKSMTGSWFLGVTDVGSGVILPQYAATMGPDE